MRYLKDKRCSTWFCLCYFHVAGTWSRHQCAGILERKRCSTWFCLCFVHVAGTWSRHQCAGIKDLAQKQTSVQ